MEKVGKDMGKHGNNHENPTTNLYKNQEKMGKHMGKSINFNGENHGKQLMEIFWLNGESYMDIFGRV